MNIFKPGDLVEVTLDDSSMLGKQGVVTARLGPVPSGGWEGYQTDIPHPSRSIGDGFGWFRPENIRLITRHFR